MSADSTTRFPALTEPHEPFDGVIKKKKETAEYTRCFNNVSFNNVITLVHFTSYGDLLNLKENDICDIIDQPLHCHTCLSLSDFHWHPISELMAPRNPLIPRLDRVLDDKICKDLTNLQVTGVSKRLFLLERITKRGKKVPKRHLVEFQTNNKFFYAFHPEALNVGAIVDLLDEESEDGMKPHISLISHHSGDWYVPYHSFRVFIQVNPEDCEYVGEHNENGKHVLIPKTLKLRFTGKKYQQEKPVMNDLSRPPFRGWNLLFEVCHSG